MKGWRGGGGWREEGSDLKWPVFDVAVNRRASPKVVPPPHSNPFNCSRFVIKWITYYLKWRNVRLNPMKPSTHTFSYPTWRNFLTIPTFPLFSLKQNTRAMFPPMISIATRARWMNAEWSGSKWWNSISTALAIFAWHPESVATTEHYPCPRNINYLMAH